MRKGARAKPELEREFLGVPIMFGANNPLTMRLEQKGSTWGIALRMPWGTVYNEPFSNEQEARRYFARYSDNLSKATGVLIDDPRFPRILR